MATIFMDPVTRIEGHLSVRTEIDEGHVKAAYCSGEMFRGFEVLLKGRDPLDAQQITQRICGVCPVSHGTASVFAQEQVYGTTPAKNGRLMRNLILGANFIQSHILHFYHLCALDFVDIAAVASYSGDDRVLGELKAWVTSQSASNVIFPAAPFLPRYEGTYLKDAGANLLAIRHYVDALEMRRLAHQMAAVFAGKLPHIPALVPGGLTESVTADKIAIYASILAKIKVFVEQAYLPDLLAVAAAFPEYSKIGRSGGNFLAFGGFPQSDDNADRFFPAGVLVQGKLSTPDIGQITEDVGYSRFSSASGLKPAVGETVADPKKSGAYSWLKAPRYQGQPMEVGPLACVMVSCQSGKNQAIKDQVNAVLAAANLKIEDLDSVLGRHVARAIESKVLIDQCGRWLDELNPDEPAFNEYTIPDGGQGAGLLDAPRGALGHWLEIKAKKISRYQCVVPTTWNCSPRDDRGAPGPVEQALVGVAVADAGNPIEVARVIRSFDPCLACAVH
jgi:ferredoxin hydrogenase large subunit/hydrogenase large subunit